ncbi:hypothetical protein [Micromonospora sp. NBS 11-29]|nr:hypothetical protein [Micromonospora sp. NBS 11-29]
MERAIDNHPKWKAEALMIEFVMSAGPGGTLRTPSVPTNVVAR